MAGALNVREDMPALSARGADRAARLLRLAAGVMARKGYHHTSMRDVGRSSDYSLAGLYHYFSSKEDLLFHIQHGVFASLLAEQERALQESAPPAEQLATLVHTHLRFFAGHADELKLCTFEMESLGGEPYRKIRDLRHRYYLLAAGIVRRLLERRGEAAGEPRVRRMTLFVFGMLNWMFMWFDPKRDRPVESLGDEMVALALDGLGSRSSAAKSKDAGPAPRKRPPARRAARSGRKARR